MQIVPIIPQTIIGVEENLELTGIAAVKPAKPVEERTLPPLLTYAHEPPVQIDIEADQHKQLQVPRKEDRRFICRRLHRLNILEELRSSIDRRRHKQRRTDLQLHVDEEV